MTRWMICNSAESSRDERPTGCAGDRKRDHPLAHRHARDHAVDQVGSALRHAPRLARGAKPAPLTGEAHQLLVAAVTTAQPQKPCASMPHSRKASNSSWTNCGRRAPVSASTCAKKLSRCSWSSSWCSSRIEDGGLDFVGESGLHHLLSSCSCSLDGSAVSSSSLLNT